MDYVTYDEDGKLTGAFHQDPHPSHVGSIIEVDEQTRLNWTNYRANEERTGLELIPPAPIDLAAVDIEFVDKVDSLIASIYAKPQRFIKEYEEREAQARDFIAREGQGEVPPRIAGFATASGLGPWSAAVLTVTQADSLRNALGQLADLRMRKYEIKRMATLDSKQTVYDDIVAKVTAIAQAIA